MKMFKKLPEGINLREHVNILIDEYFALSNKNFLIDLEQDVQKYFVSFTEGKHTVYPFGPRIEFDTLWFEGKRYILPLKYKPAIEKIASLDIRKTYAQNCLRVKVGQPRVFILEKGKQIFGEIINFENQGKTPDTPLAEDYLPAFEIECKRHSRWNNKKVSYKSTFVGVKTICSEELALIRSDFYHSIESDLGLRGPFPLEEIYQNEKTNEKIFKEKVEPFLIKEYHEILGDKGLSI
jgi:hypothetical protein